MVRPIEHSPNPSSCKLCGKSFDSETELVTHEVTDHPNVSGARPQEQESKKGDKAA